MAPAWQISNVSIVRTSNSHPDRVFPVRTPRHLGGRTVTILNVRCTPVPDDGWIVCRTACAQWLKSCLLQPAIRSEHNACISLPLGDECR